MASRTLGVRINASDNASATFSKVGDAAQDMASSIEDAADSGDGFKALTDQIKSLDSEINTVGKAMTGIGAVITGALAAPLAMGTKAAFDQVNAVQQATFALGAYGDSAEDVNAALRDLTAYAQDASRSGGIFWSEDLYEAAQSLVTVGVELDRVSGYVQIMSRSVGIGRIEWDELNRILGRVVATGRLTSVEFDLLRQAGFQLDESLRNTTVTAEELFTALDQGLSADVLLGQADTIRGALLYLEGSLINIGQAFLGVNEDLEFVAGGLGDQLVNSITVAREVLLSGTGAVEAFGNAAASIVGSVNGLAAAFTLLPDGIQTAAFGLAGFTGAATLAAGATLLIVPRIAETISAFNALRRSALAAQVGMAALRFTPIGLAITGVVAAGVGLHAMLTKTNEDAVALAEGIEGLNDEIERLKLNAESGTASALQWLVNDIEAIRDILDETDPQGWIEEFNLPPDTNTIGLITSDLADDLSTASGLMDDFVDHVTEVYQSLSSQEARQAYIDYVREMLSTVESTLEGSTLPDIIDEVINTPASEIPSVMDAIAASTDGLADANDRASLAIDRYVAAQRSALEILGELDQDERDRLAWQTEAERTAHANREISLQTRIEREQEAADAIIGIVEDYMDRYNELMETGRELAGFDTPLAQAAMSGLAGDAGLLAQNLTVAGQAADNVFRIIVGNTDAIKSQADQTLAWADGLIAVRGEWSRLDELVQQGLITGRSGEFDVDTQYAAAQDAYDSIAISTETIKNNLDAVQAIQAPLIAEAQEGVAAWTEELLGMDAAQQRVALGWYDATTAAQAMEAQMLATAVSAGQLGANGEEAFEGFIRGAVAANPVLFDLLKSMELVSGTPMDFEVTLDGAGEAQSEIATLTETIETLNAILAEAFGIDIDVTGGDEASQVVRDIIDLVGDLDGTTATVNVEMGAAGAGAAAAGGLTSLVDQLGIPEQIDVQVNVDGAEEIDAVQSAIDALTDTSVTVSIVADDSDAQAAAAYWVGHFDTTFAQVTVDFVADETDVNEAMAFWLGKGGALEGQDIGPGGAAATVTVAFVADTSAIELETLASSLYPDGIEVSVAFTADTSAVDNALAGYGIGAGADGNPSGGAASFDRPTIRVGIEADTSDLNTALDGEYGPITVAVEADTTALAGALAGITVGTALNPPTIEVPITGNTGGRDGALTQMFNLAAAADNHAVNLPIKGDTTDAVAAIESLTGAADGVPPTVTISAIALTSGAVFALEGVTAAANDIPETETVAVTALAAGATAALEGVTAAANDIPGDVSVSVSVSGAAAAVAALNSVANAARNIPASATTTITTNRVTNNITRFSSQGVRTAAHGGVIGLPHFAGGGMVPFWAGENGPEIAHFAAGGTALLPHEGLYAAPPMTYISPNNAVSTSYGGDVHLTVNHYGGGSRDEMNAWAEEDLIPAVQRAVRQQERGMGV